MRNDLESYIATVLGPTTTLRDRTWLEWGDTRVLEVRDADGVRWFVKCHRRLETYRREATAYRRWAPALGDRAPVLLTDSNELQTLVLSALPGEPSSECPGPEALYDAGVLLRRFHDSELLEPWQDMAAEKQSELEYWVARSNGLLGSRQLDFARHELGALDGLAAPTRVPCHLDYSPRNWLVVDGRVHVIDFGDAGPEAWVNDFGRLFVWWRLSPDLKAAFLDGYGRQPSEGDLAVLRASYVLTTVWAIIRAHEYGNARIEAGCRKVLSGLMSNEFS